MNGFDITEKRFEEDIEASLLSQGGYQRGTGANYDPERGMDVASFVQFVKQSQPKAWQKYEAIYGVKSEQSLVERFCQEVKQTSLLSVLRRGFKDRGIPFRVVYWQPETSLNATSAAQYEANILHCTRQLHYSARNRNSIDMVLFVNGIPVVSMELKCQFTGQNVNNALKQYRFDRAGKETLFAFKQRVLVHFAVDLSNVYMTTRLEGASTYFLPFNQGSGGAGNVGGKGNPVNPQGYASAYLWENVLRKERLLEILQKYLHEQDGRLIFPRYHQLDVVTKLLAEVRSKGAGANYLIQHSAGSGKSNSIAWLAHRLASLHDAQNEKIFQSVVIVTDRRVLDNQLQDTVYQFDHVEGVVKKIDQNSKQLKEALMNATPVIITTLQKFPVIYQEVNLTGKKFAVIVDEAHSSQNGEAAKKLKSALADTEELLKEYAQEELSEEQANEKKQDWLLEELSTHGSHKNLSFFAFTATPKDKTLNIFGRCNAEGKYEPFHVYSMRQAIEEGFILNVLRNYMTYNMYFKIIKTIEDDPELDSAEGTKAVRQYETLHPHNIAQKTKVMLEHFCDVTMKKIDGKAKAMVVTPSRLHAVRYVQEFKRQIRENNLKGVDVLVAFSGEVYDDGESYTETGMNRNAQGEHIPENALPQEFHSADFNILIVAEKYQTGFDEPLLHTMFVDKKLSGVKAVQTLSRLNRTTRGKQDTFVLDFVNSSEDIRDAFAPYFEETVLENETNPNVVYDIRHTLDQYRVYQEQEIKRFGEIFFSSAEQAAKDLGKLQGTLLPALDRYAALEKEAAQTFKTTLARFNRIYSFITQVCRMFDRELHTFAVYARFLEKVLPKGERERIDLDEKILLEYYKLEKGFEGDIELEPVAGGMTPITGETGRGERKKDTLTVIIDKINEKFATQFTEMDKVLLQLQNDYVNREEWSGYAKTGTKEAFMDLFKKDFQKTAANRYMQNEAFFTKLFSDEMMMNEVISLLGPLLYERLKKQAHPITDQTCQDYEIEYTKTPKVAEN